jgi:hypothetical protein
MAIGPGAIVTAGASRKVYVLMWTEPGNGSARSRAMFATGTRKRPALKRAKALSATVYAIPYPGTGWDCPTIRATFDPIYVPM